MPKTKISEFSATPGNNTDIDGINIAEGCAPSGINDAIRELMAQLKDFQAGTAGDSFNGPVGTTTAAAGAFTTLSASSTVSGAGFSTYLASPPAIGGTAAAAGSFTTLTTSSTVTHNGGTANGVAYLNGSKVLTTGSALTFDGTNLSTGNGSFLANGTTGITSFRATTTSNYAELQSRPDISYSRLLSSAYLLDIATLANQPILFTVNSSEGMRLTSTGLGIGTSSPGAKLDVIGTQNISGAASGSATGTLVVKGAQSNSNGLSLTQNSGTDTSSIFNFYSGPLLFGTNDTERARITSGGEFLVGTTTVGAGIKSKTYYASSAAGNFIDSWYSDSGSAENLRAAFRVDGGLANYSANDVNLSDRREKTNFAPAKSYIDVICAIPVQTFNFIGQTDDEKTLGVVAQDVQAVAPELVSESNWGTDDNPKMRLGIYQTDLQYALMKCIQEQQVMINELKAKVAALEAK